MRMLGYESTSLLLQDINDDRVIVILKEGWRLSKNVNIAPLKAKTNTELLKCSMTIEQTHMSAFVVIGTPSYRFTISGDRYERVVYLGIINITSNIYERPELKKIS